MRLFISGRQEGKTTRLIDWVKQGRKTQSYPGWDRIMLVPAMADADHIRRANNPHGLDYRQVFCLAEYKAGKFGRLPVEIGIDNVDLVLAALLDTRYDRVEVATMTAEPWTSEP